jgi:AraC-like DNA-binding protein
VRGLIPAENTSAARAGAIRSEVSTDDVAPAERFAYWREECCAPVGVTTERDMDNPTFSARVSRLTARALTNVRYDTVTPCHVQRTRREISQRPWDSCSLYRELSAGAWFSRGGQEFTTRTGDLIVADLDMPFETRSLGTGFRHDVWLIPNTTLTPYLPASTRPILRRFSAMQGVEALLSASLDVLGREADAMSADCLSRVTDNLCRLIGIAYGAAADDHSEAVRDARVARAKQYIDAHLADPGLSPARIAAALRVSLRSLHLAFAPTGVSVAHHIQLRRLEECRSMLVACPSRSVTDIAFAWGFNSLSGFYRAFHNAFGASPGDLRTNSVTQLHASGSTAAR